MAAVSVGVFGGTFDPVHNGHVILAECALEQLGLERVLWIPAGDPWRKADSAITPAEQRVEMVRLAIADEPAFELRTMEVDRPGPSYSVDTLAELHEELPDRELVLLLGLDALRDLPNWHEPAGILSLARVAVAARGAQPLSSGELEELAPGLAERTVWIEMPYVDTSGTELRRLAAEGRSLRGQIPDAVETYIRRQRLYR